MPPSLDRALAATGEAFDELWRNDLYEVFVRYLESRGRDGALHLSIKRLDREPVADWRHKQAIKNEIAGPLREAMELFPAESRLVDCANQTHVWVLPVEMDVPLGYQEWAAFDKADAVRFAAQRGYDPRLLDGGKQRPWQPGLSTGPDYARRHGWLRD